MSNQTVMVIWKCENVDLTVNCFVNLAHSELIMVKHARPVTDKSLQEAICYQTIADSNFQLLYRFIFTKLLKC